MNIRQKYSLFIIIVLLCIAFVEFASLVRGASSSAEDEGKVSETEKDLTEIMNLDRSDISAFIADTFPGDERAINGEWTSQMKEVADQYLAVMERMAEKYPSYSIKITRCNPQSLLGPAYNVFYVMQEGDSDLDEREVYVRRQEKDEDSVYDIEDAFIGSIIEPMYSSLIHKELQNKVSGCYLVETEMKDVYGDEYNEDLKAENVLTGNPPMWNRTNIWVSEGNEKSDELIKVIKDILTQKGNCGRYQIYITETEDKNSSMVEKDVLVIPVLSSM